MSIGGKNVIREPGNPQLKSCLQQLGKLKQHPEIEVKQTNTNQATTNFLIDTYKRLENNADTIYKVHLLHFFLAPPPPSIFFFVLDSLVFNYNLVQINQKK